MEILGKADIFPGGYGQIREKNMGGYGQIGVHRDKASTSNTLMIDISKWFRGNLDHSALTHAESLPIQHMTLYISISDMSDREN